jgi:hypothetical protein
MLSLLVALAVAQVPTSLTLEVGETRRITVPGLQRIAVSGADVYDVKTRGRDEVEIIGFSPGRSTLLIWRSRGDRVSIDLRVVPATPKTKTIAVPVTRTVERVSVNGREQKATVFTFPEALAQITEATDVDGGVLLKGLTTSGERLEILVTPR